MNGLDTFKFTFWKVPFYTQITKDLFTDKNIGLLFDGANNKVAEITGKNTEEVFNKIYQLVQRANPDRFVIESDQKRNGKEIMKIAKALTGEVSRINKPNYTMPTKKKVKKAAPKKAAKKRVAANYTKDRQTGSSSKLHDAMKKAMAPGKRISTSGNTYYEYRKNRTDRRGSMLGLSGFFDTQIISDLDQLKKEYHKLAIIYHPDKGGTKEQFQQLQNEYEAKLRAMLRGSNLNKEQQDNEIAIDENLRQAINAVITIPGINIELVGKWIWIGGNTYPVRNELKAANFQFAPVKKMWYYKGVESSGRGNMSYDEIKSKYGAERITPKNSQQFLSGIDYKIQAFSKVKFKAALKRLTKALNKRYV